MNTIASNRQNDRHGPDIATVIDRAAAEMKEHSPGTALIDGLMADSWDGGDPWGSTLEAWFALEYVCQFLGWPNHPTFSSPYTTGDPDEGWLYTVFLESVQAGQITSDDIEFARTILERMHHAFDLAGLSY